MCPFPTLRDASPEPPSTVARRYNNAAEKGAQCVADKKPQGTRTFNYLTATNPAKGFDGTVTVPPPNGTPPSGCTFIPRLSLMPLPMVDYDPGRLAERLTRAEDRVVYFADNSLFDDQTDHR